MDQFINQQFMNILDQAQGNAAIKKAKTAGQTLENQSRVPKNIEAIEKTAQEFEAVFIAEMLKPMFEGIDTGGPFGGGQGEEIYRGMMLGEYGKVLANSNSIGIADQVKAEMIRIQEAESKNSQSMPQQMPQQMSGIQDAEFIEIE